MSVMTFEEELAELQQPMGCPCYSECVCTDEHDAECNHMLCDDEAFEQHVQERIAEGEDIEWQDGEWCEWVEWNDGDILVDGEWVAHSCGGGWYEPMRRSCWDKTVPTAQLAYSWLKANISHDEDF